MITRIYNVDVVDNVIITPGTPGAGEIWFQDGRLIHPLSRGKADREIDGGGAYALAGAIDLHTHIGGGKLALARMLTGERAYENCATSTPRPYLPAARETGRKYLEMGYTAAFEPAMLPTGARATHWELSDVSGLETGGYVVLGNEPPLLEMIAANASVEQIADYVATMVSATGALAVKVVNPGGIDAFKYNLRSLDVDQRHPHYGVTPRMIIAALTAAIDHLHLPHPLHVHASNLGAAGSANSLIATMDAAQGRIHLTHIQFHSYGDAGPQGFSSAAADVARYVNTHRHISVDIGQVVFGKTCLLSADVMRLDVIRKQIDARKFVCGLLENESGCGVIPFEYKDSHFVHALQWLIGLELLLLIEDPWRVFLTTDHPNGGPFTSYPYLIRLLMDRSFRESEVDRLPKEAIAASSIRGLTREYTLDEIAIMTRSAPARALGLRHRGQLESGSVADVVLYKHEGDWQQTFAHPQVVIAGGQQVIADGRWIADHDLTMLGGRVIADVPPASPRGERATMIEQQYGIAASQFAISRDELADITGGRLTMIPTR